MHSAMPSVTAKRKCPDLIFVPPRFDVYRQVSEQIREIFAEYTPLIEPLSLDEAYLDVTENLKAWRSPPDSAEIRAKIKASPASTRPPYFLQQVPGQDGKRPEQAKRTGRHHAEERPGLCRSPARQKIPWRGPATAERMRRHGIETGLTSNRSRSPSCSSTSASPPPYFYGIARAALTRGRSGPTGYESPSVLKTHLQRTSMIWMRPRPSCAPWLKKYGAIARRTTSLEEP